MKASQNDYNNFKLQILEQLDKNHHPELTWKKVLEVWNSLKDNPVGLLEHEIDSFSIGAFRSKDDPFYDYVEQDMLDLGIK